MTAETAASILVRPSDFDRVPGALRERAQWLVWRSEQRVGEQKPRKVPYYASGGRRVGTQGDDADRAKLVSFERAAASVATGKFTGIGFAFLPGDGLIGIDLDDCINAETSEITDRAAGIIKACGSYTEFSPSGKGVHIYSFGETGSHKSNEIGVEMFCGRQFFTVTGRQYPDTVDEVTPIADAVVERLHQVIDDGRRKHRATRAPAPSRAVAFSGNAPADRDRIDSALAAVSADIGYNDWIGVGMALYDALGESAGLQVWDYWSSKGAKYAGRAALEGHWKSFGNRAPGSDALIFKLAMEGGWRPPKAPRASSGASTGGGAVKAAKPASPAESADAAAEPPTGSEIALARQFALRERDNLRWSPGLEWLANRGEHWSRDEDLRRFSAAKSLCSEEAKRAKPLSAGAKLASSKTVNAVLTLARDEPHIVTPVNAWDREPMLLNTPGGVFNLATGRRQERGDLLFTQVAGVAPDARLPTPRWLRFIAEIFSGDLAIVEFLQRWVGYCLTGDRREHKLVFWYGAGANGKSVLQEIIQAAMGTYALSLPAEVLMRQTHQQHPTELAQLRGKRLALSSEIEDSAYWAESRIKALTGDATLTARFMRQDFFEFPQTQKHLIAGNYKPRLKGDDPAIARRMVLVPFLERFTGSRCDPLLSLKLGAELGGILAWFIEGARKWSRDGLAIPPAVRAASAEYLAANDDISLWLEDCCRIDGHHRTPNAHLYRSYYQWKTAAGEHPQSSTAWGQRLAQRFDTYRTNHERGYVGIEVIESGQAALDLSEAQRVR